MALYNMFDPGPEKPRTPADPPIKGVDILKDEYLYKGLSPEDAKRFKLLNDSLKNRGEIYDPQRKRVFKIGKIKGGTDFLVTNDEVFDSFNFDYNPLARLNTPSQSQLPGLIKASGFYTDPKSGDIFPMK